MPDGQEAEASARTANHTSAVRGELFPYNGVAIAVNRRYLNASTSLLFLSGRCEMLQIVEILGPAGGAFIAP